MYSAGQVPPTSQTTVGAAPPASPAPPVPAIAMPALNAQPYPMNAFGGYQFNVKGDISPEVMKTMIDSQGKWMAGAMIGNGAATLVNQIGAMYGMSLQSGVIGQYYNYLNKVADNGMTVALKQADVQMKAMDYARIMQKEQQNQDWRIAQLNAQLQKSLLRITEQHKDIRADKYIANNQFLAKQYLSPQPYYYGQPVSYSRS